MTSNRLFSTERIRTFSDSVFAIAVTLLILDLLNIPVLHGKVTNQAALNVLLQMLPQIGSFILSFITVCIFWVNHHHFFYLIKRADSKLMWLNNLLLFWVCFIPFPTTFLAHYFPNIYAILFYGFVSTFAGISFGVIGDYALDHEKIMYKHITKRKRDYLRQRSYWGIIASVIVMAIAIPIALLSFIKPIPIYLSLALFFCFICIPFRYFIPPRI